MRDAVVDLNAWMAITQAISEQVWLVDNGCADQALDLYARQTRLEFAPGSPKPAVYQGREQVKGFLDARAQQTGVKSRHVVSNVRLLAQHDGSILATSLLTLYRSGGSGRDTDAAFVADILESYVCEADGVWRISNRIVTPVFASPAS